MFTDAVWTHRNRDSWGVGQSYIGIDPVITVYGEDVNTCHRHKDLEQLNGKKSGSAGGYVQSG